MASPIGMHGREGDESGKPARDNALAMARRITVN